MSRRSWTMLTVVSVAATASILVLWLSGKPPEPKEDPTKHPKLAAYERWEAQVKKVPADMVGEEAQAWAKDLIGLTKKFGDMPFSAKENPDVAKEIIARFKRFKDRVGDLALKTE